MNDPARALESAEIILLVDWPSPDVPRALVESRRTVFGYSPSGYSKAEIVSDADGSSLVFRKIEGRPPRADIVAVYRPEKEMPEILAKHVLPLKAKTVWLLRPAASDAERALVEKQGLRLIEGRDAAEAARAITKRTGGSSGA